MRNGHRLQIGRTKILKYKDDYEKQQVLLNETIYVINFFIIEQNVQSGIVTPFLHTYVHKKKGSKIRYFYSKLVDGVHPSDQLALLWKQQLERAMQANEQNVVVHWTKMYSFTYLIYSSNILLLFFFWLLFYISYRKYSSPKKQP